MMGFMAAVEACIPCATSCLSAARGGQLTAPSGSPFRMARATKQRPRSSQAGAAKN